MQVSVIKIGNSRGIRIPMTILNQLEIKEKVDLEVQDKEIIIKPVNNKPRSGWKESFMKMHEKEDDRLLIDGIEEEEDFEWEW